MNYQEGLEYAEIKKDEDPWVYEGVTVLVSSPTQIHTLATIVEPYDPEEENDEDVEYGQVFWCKRLDGKPWDKKFKHGVKYGNTWLAVHHMYLFKPPKGDWDSEENYG